MTSQKFPALRIFTAMIIGLFIIETMIELSTGTTLMGGRNGIFISQPHSDAKTVNTPMNASALIIADTDIRETPSLTARKVGKLEAGIKLSVIGKTTVGKKVWYQVQRFGGKIGYLSADSVRIK